jgi:hypothetical protein
MEEYKIIEGFENYSISKSGNVKNNITGRILKTNKNERGYYRVALCKNGDIKKTFKVHRLVASTFIPNPENKPQIDHIDGNKINNNVNNLRWCTNSENNHNKGITKNNTSGVKGVHFHKQSNKWRAEITNNGKKYHIGCFDTIEDASKARRTKAKELFGKFINTTELEININNAKPNKKLILNINIKYDEQNDIDELEKEFEGLLK